MKTSKLVCAWAATLVIAVAVLPLSQDSHAQQAVVLKNVNVIDGTGAPAQPNSTVIIAGDRIQSISTKQQPPPVKAKLIDMHGFTIMPLIINTHGHLGLVRGTSISAANQTEDNIRHQLLRYQEYGVGAVLSMGTDGPKFAEIRQASREGILAGADVFSAGIGMGAKDGVPPISIGFTTVLRPTTPAEGRRYVAEQAALRPDFIKIWVDDFWGQYQKLQGEIYKAIIDEAHLHGMRVAAHLYYLEDARSLVTDGVDVLARSIRDREIDDALLAEMRKHRVAYIPTLSLDDFASAYGDSPAWVSEPFFRTALDPGVFEMITSPEYKAKTRASKVFAQETTALPIAMRNLKRIYNGGILVALGTDSGATPIRVQGFAEHMELALMVEAGLTPLQAISVATRNSAQLLGIAEQYRTLEPGKKANFIVLEKDPSQNIRNTQSIRAVWKSGIKASDGPVAPAPSVTH
jgi:imidazolonepropionase-like amidohydrolase